MKILIISPPRCGSSALLIHISDVSNIDGIREPFNYLIKRPTEYKYPRTVTENSVTKYITTQTPIEYGVSDDFINFINDDIINYNKVILLSRRNTAEHLESLINLNLRTSRGQKIHSTWYSDDLKQALFDTNLQPELEYHVGMINKISSNIDIPLTYYEDLYGEDRIKSHDIIKNWNLDIDVNSLNEKLNPRYRYRQFTTKPLL